jgi:hypothetical protein
MSDMRGTWHRNISNVLVIVLASTCIFLFTTATVAQVAFDSVDDMARSIHGHIRDVLDRLLNTGGGDTPFYAVFVRATWLLVFAFIALICIDSRKRVWTWVSLLVAVNLIPVLGGLRGLQYTICEARHPNCGKPDWENIIYAAMAVTVVPACVAIAWVFVWAAAKYILRPLGKRENP